MILCVCVRACECAEWCELRSHHISVGLLIKVINLQMRSSLLGLYFSTLKAILPNEHLYLSIRNDTNCFQTQSQLKTMTEIIFAANVVLCQEISAVTVKEKKLL